MSIDGLITPLLRVPLFQGLRPLQITEIARVADRVVFERGDFIVEAGRSGDGSYLIISGAAEQIVETNRSASAAPVEPGSMIGEMAMLIEHVYGTTVVARGHVRVLKITRAAIHAQMLSDPRLADHFMQRIAGRLLQLADDMRRIDSALVRTTVHASQRSLPASERTGVRPSAYHH